MQYNLWDRNVPESRELSDSELDRVTGGGYNTGTTGPSRGDIEARGNPLMAAFLNGFYGYCGCSAF
jgi:hypothetical protein